MGKHSCEDDFDFSGSNEPDYEAIIENRRDSRRESSLERAERSYERYMTG